MAHTTLSPMARPPARRGDRAKLWVLLGAFAVVVLLGVAACFIEAYWPYRYRNIKPMLEGVLASQIKISQYHRTYFPNPGFVAIGITMRRKSAPDLPPLGSVEKLVVQGSWIDLIMLRDRVQLVDMTGLHVVVPPIGSRANHEDFPPGSSSDFAGPDTMIEKLDVHQGLLDIMRDDGNRYSFPIQELELRDFQKGHATQYAVEMSNAKPTGRIVAKGSLGPINAKNMEASPVTGEFTFTSVALHDVGEIQGTLSSSGRFNGTLGKIDAEATSNTPDFAVENGHPSPVEAAVRCTIDGRNGDVVIQGIEAKTGATTVNVAGSVAGERKVANLDFIVTGGRAEDVLRIFVHDGVPIAGPVRLHGHAYVGPTGNGAHFLQRLRVDGVFDVPAERIKDEKTEQSLTEFSQRAQSNKPANSDARTDEELAGSSTDVLSSLNGPATIRDGVVGTQHLIFRFPGAEANLKGTFNLHDKSVHLTGDLKMETDISNTTTGFKSWLLKPLAPFFKKKSAGAVIPIAVVGGPGNYKVTQDLTHSK